MMRRSLLIFCVLSVFVTVNAYAILVSVTDFSGDSAITVAADGSILVNLNDFFADPAVTVAVDGSSATIAEDAFLGMVLLSNDPGLEDPNVIIPGNGISLGFNYDFVEGATSDDEFGVFILDGTTGLSLGPAFEFFTQNTSSGSISFDLSYLVGDTLGVQFQLASDVNFDSVDGLDSVLTISNVKLIKESVADSYSTDEDTPLIVGPSGVLDNDTDVDNKPLIAILVSDVSNGTLNLNADGDGSFIYTPVPEYNGSDSFTYKANDGAVDSNTATVTITVNAVNDAPVAATNGPYTGEEGSTILLDASGSSDLDGDSLQYRWDFDDNETWDTPLLNDATLLHAWNDNYAGAIVLEVTDGELTDTNTASVTVSNLAPVVVACVNQEIGEGTELDLELATFADPGSADTHTATINWGDGSATEDIDPATSPIVSSHNYADNDVYTVTVTVTDDDGASTPATFDVTVLNAAPTMEAGVDQIMSEGAVVSLAPSTFNDPGTLDTHTATVDWGDGTSAEAGTVTETPSGPPGATSGTDGAVSGEHVYADDGIYMVTVTVTDDDGASISDTLMVTVENAVPTVAAGEDVTAEEGALVSLASSSFNDLGTSDTHIASIDWGDGTPPEVGVIVEAPFGPPGSVGGANGAVSASHVYGDNGVYTVILAVEDDEEASGADICVITVSNVAPNITNISAPTDPIPAETLITASVTFEDLGILDTHLVTWDWGDGTSSEMAIDEDSSIHSASGDHTYIDAGVYTIGITVADDEGALDEAIFQFVVIYDPDGGFVTGGGWIDSPPGAYMPEDLTDPDLTGKANFGFVSKYKKGADLPTGNTEFIFQVAELEFHSTEYEWLVVAGAQAKFKGTGTINDDGNYGFMLSAVDGDLKNQDDELEENSEDKFRIKIWDKDDNDKVIYDNQAGGADDADPTTILGGGSIVIHGEKQGKPNAAPAMLPNGTRLLAAYPNPFNPDVWIPYQLGTDSQVTICIYSLAGHLVRTIDLGAKSAGFYVDRAKAAHWDGRNEAGEYAASGIYFYSLQAGGYTATKKMIVAK